MKLPALELLAQAYLNLDWPDDHPDAWAAVDDFVVHEPISSQLAPEVTLLLEATPDEDDLRRLVIGELGCGYLPEGDGFTMREWLLALSRRVQGAGDSKR